MNQPDEQKLFYVHVGRQISVWRQRRNISQETLANRIGLTRSSLSNIENGRQHASLFLVTKVAQHLSMDISELIPQQIAEPKLAEVLRKHTRNFDEGKFIRTVLGNKVGASRAD